MHRFIASWSQRPLEAQAPEHQSPKSLKFGNSIFQGGPGTEPEPETGTVGTVFPGTERGTGTAGTVFQELKPEPSSLLHCTETHKNPLLRGTAGTEIRNRSNRSIPKP